MPISTPNLLGTDVVAGDAALYFIPSDWGSTAVLYNTDQVPAEDVASLGLPEPRYAQRITLPDNVDDAYALAYLATGVTDWSTATEEQFQAASDWLRQVHPNLRTYWTDPAELAPSWPRARSSCPGPGTKACRRWAKACPSPSSARPAEGSSLWLCGFVNMADAPGSEDKAYDFVNAFLDPSSTSALVEPATATPTPPR
jgi:spermidine/putrescine transport system substrate-binding protein